MVRGGTVFALALVLSLGAAPAAAQPQARIADVFLKEQGDEYFAGENLLSADGAGQQRSLIVTDEIVILVKVQNDGDTQATFTVTGSDSENGFELRYLRGGKDVTDEIVSGDLALRIAAGKKRSIRVEVDATGAEFAAKQPVIVSAVSDDTPTDAARAEVTKIS
jgi:hypothetical protein